jgi:hypothetical protein
MVGTYQVIWTCPDCGRDDLKAAHGLTLHRRRSHGWVAPAPVPTLAREKERRQTAAERQASLLGSGTTWPGPGFSFKEALETGDFELIEEHVMWVRDGWLVREAVVGGTRWIHTHTDPANGWVREALKARGEARGATTPDWPEEAQAS